MESISEIERRDEEQKEEDEPVSPIKKGFAKHDDNQDDIGASPMNFGAVKLPPAPKARYQGFNRENSFNNFDDNSAPP